MQQGSAIRRRDFFLVIALVLLMAGAFAVAARTVLLKAGIETYLAARGWPAARLDVKEFTFHRIALENLALGAGAPSATRIVVENYLQRPFAADVEGLRLPVDIGRGAATGSLGDDLTGWLESAASPRAWISKLVLHDAVATVRGAAGAGITVTADGEVDLADPGRGSAIEGHIAGPQTDAAFRLETGPVAGLPRVHLAMTGSSNLAELPWPPQVPGPQSGRASFKLDAVLPLPPPGAFAANAPNLDGLVVMLDLHLESVTAAPRVEGLAADASLRIEGAPDGIAVRLRQPVPVTAAAVAIPELAGLGPAFAPLADRFAHGVDMTLDTDRDAAFATLNAEKDGWSLDSRGNLKMAMAQGEMSLSFAGVTHYDASLNLREMQAMGLNLYARDLPLGSFELPLFAWTSKASLADGAFIMEGPLQIKLAKLEDAGLAGGTLAFDGEVRLNAAAGDVSIQTQKPGALSIEGAPRVGAFRFDGPLAAKVVNARLTRTAGAVAAEAAVKPGAVQGTFEREGRRIPFRAEAASLAIRAQLAGDASGDVRIDKGSLALPAENVSLRDVQAAVPFAAGQVKAVRLSASLQSSASPADFSPLAVKFSGTRKKNVFDGKGVIDQPATKLTAPIAARYDMKAQRGEIRFGPSDAVFAEGGLQPADLGPALAGISKASGTVHVETTVSLDAATGLAGRGRLAFDSLSFETADAGVEGLSGTMEIADLVDLRTPPGQNFTAKRVTVVEPLDDVALRFSLDRDKDGPVVAVEEATGRIADGILAVNDAKLHVGAPSNTVSVKVNRVSVARLLERFGTDSIKGTGILSGSIPITFGDEGISITDGRIKADETGVLQVHFGSAKETLEKQGQAMKLMTQALEDFHYSAFEMGVTRRAGAGLDLTIRLEGMNPAVLDGYPFRFNIALSGDTEPLLTALKAGRGLSADVLGGAIAVKP